MTSPRRTRAVTAGRAVAELLLTAGVVVLLFASYELVGTDWAAARGQEAAAARLDRSWAGPTGTASPPPAVGEPVVRLHVPRFGAGWSRVVLEGTGPDVLARGPGHYTGTARPGEVGNVALAGHRVGSGGPFGSADRLRSCDPIVLEGRDGWSVYRVLPLVEEVAGWSAGPGRRPQCAGVGPPAGVYAGTVGQEIVRPTQVEVIAPVPHRPGAAPSVPLLTLTTCHPPFSARERLVVHAVLVRTVPRGGPAPAELTEV